MLKSLESPLRESRECERLLDVWTRLIEPLLDPTENLAVDPRLKKRPTWKYREGAKDGALHGVTWQLSLYYALALLRLDRNTVLAGKIIQRVVGLQERSETSPDFGNFRHILELEQVGDRNTIFFVNFALLVAVREFPDRLDSTSRQTIEESFPLSLQNLLAGDAEANFSYTNANLGRIACGLLIAERLEEQVARQHLIGEFFEAVRVNTEWGVAERLSDTYYMVNVIALAMITAYSQSKEAAAQGRSLLDVMIRELRFFGNRQPLPARRTYNQETGVATKFTVLDWLLGDLSATVDEMPTALGRRSPAEPPDETFRTHGGWAAVIEPVLRHLEAQLPSAPRITPRSMEGRLVGTSFYRSYLNERYTLGTISDYPTLNLRHQHVSDMPVGFSGENANLGFTGMYAIDDEGICHSHPGRHVEVSRESGAHHGMPGSGRPAIIRSAAVQHRNIGMVLYDLDGLNAKVREAGILLRVPQFRGILADEQGSILKLESGDISGPWCFLEMPGFFVGVRALSQVNPWTRMIEERGFRYELSRGHLQLFLPLLRTETPVEIQSDSLSAGIVLACHSSDHLPRETFVQKTRQWKVEECWDDDRYTYRSGPSDYIRRIRLSLPEASLSLDYDCRLHRTLSRTINGYPVSCPEHLCAISAGGPELL